MRNTVFAFIAFLSLGTLCAQPVSNSLYFSGSIGLSTENSSTESGGTTVDGPQTTEFSFNPVVGYTLTDNILVGVRGIISTSKTTTPDVIGDDDQINRSSTTGAALFGRYYIPITDQLFFYPELDLLFTGTSSENEIGNVTTELPKSSTFGVGVIPGLAFYPSPRWGFELSAGFVGFTSTKTVDEAPDPDTETTQTNFDFNLNALSVNIGVSYLLPMGGS